VLNSKDFCSLVTLVRRTRCHDSLITADVLPSKQVMITAVSTSFVHQMLLPVPAVRWFWCHNSVTHVMCHITLCVCHCRARLNGAAFTAALGMLSDVWR
jgi:hypothetical protein